MVDALVAKAEEGRGRLRKVLGSRQQAVIQQYPNGATPAVETWLTPRFTEIQNPSKSPLQKGRL